jgi:radical SAM superfamily enzyme YgiQ (UPF0313 family)
LHEILKRENPRAKTIIGGAHPSAVHSLIKAGQLDDPNIPPLEKFDYIVVGEGERMDITSLEKGWNMEPLMRDINELDIPDRSLIDIASYKYELKGDFATTVMSQRGCPFSCSFCCGRDVDMYRRVRSKSPEKILEELDYLNSEFGFSSFMWFDDEVNVNSPRLKALSGQLQKRSYSHRGFVRSDLLVRNPETLDYLADAGFVELCSGVESGSAEILDRVGKGTTPEINSEEAQMIMNKGIDYKSFTIIGHPGETYEDIEKTKDWIRNNRPDGFDVTILTPYPGSRLYDHSKPSSRHEGFDREWNGLFFKRIDYSSEASFYKGKSGEYVCNVRTDELKPEDLLKIRDDIDTELRLEIKN